MKNISHYLFLCIVETHYSEDCHMGATWQTSSKTQDNSRHAKKVLSDIPKVLDFVVSQAHFVSHLPNS